jgi:thiol-disulfide isomerase/thioredoxin
MTSRLRLAATLSALVLLAGCTDSPVVTRSAAPPATTSSAPSVGRAPDSSGLAPAKRSAGIADCPTSDPEVPAVSDGLPDAVLACLGGGRPVRLAGLRGRPMIINVWAQWCGPCRQEAPFLAAVADDSRTDLLVLGIDHQDLDPAAALEFARSAGWTYPQLQDRDQVLRSGLRVTALPVTFFVRADGTIAHRNFVPFTSADQIRLMAEQHLGVRP